MLAEVAAPAVGEAGIALALYAAFLVAFGLLYVWRHTLGDVLRLFAAWAANVSVGAGRFSIHPLSPIAHAADWIDQAVDNALSLAVENTQRGSLALFHLAAHQLTQLGHEIGGLAYDVAAAFQRTATQTIPTAVLHATHALTQRLATAERAVNHALNVELPAVEHRISTLDNARKAAEAAAAREVGTIGHEVSVVLPHEISVADAWIGRTAKQARAAARRLTNIEALLTVSGVAALVGVALSTLKLNWIKCPALGRIAKKHGCRPWQALEHLLSPALDVLVVMNVCDIARVLTPIATAAGPVITQLVSVESAALCHGRIAALHPLTLTRTANPTPISPLAL